MKLVADIGGTKTLLALADEAGRLHCVERFACENYPDFPALLHAYRQAQPRAAEVIAAACFALAGPLADDGRSACLTNRPWTIDAAALEEAFGLPRISLVNDFAAAALGVTRLTAGQLHTLQNGQPVSDDVRLVLGAGTGLGVALLVKQEQGWRVLPGEGGHIGFAPQDEQQDRLCLWLRRLYGRVSNERLVSGAGLAAIYAFLHEQGERVADTEEPAAIAARAREGKLLALTAFDLFAAIYGAVAGDLALLALPRGGVYLAGGIAAQNLDLMRRGAFLDAFRAKGRHALLAERMPVHVVTEPLLGLHGAAALCH